MTEDQKKYYNAMKKLGSKKPQKPIPKPRVCTTFSDVHLKGFRFFCLKLDWPELVKYILRI